MIYIAVALYPEAKPWIVRLDLKKDADAHRYQMFRNEQCTLVITGVGPLAAAIAVTYMLQRVPATEGDLFVNLGVCGGLDDNDERGWMLCHTLLDVASGRTSFPDMVHQHPFVEVSLATVARPLQQSQYAEVERLRTLGVDVVDMEASGCVAAASHEFAPHQMVFLKIVSDQLEPNRVTSSLVEQLISIHLEKVLDWLLSVAHSLKPEPLLAPIEERLLEQLNRDLRLTVTMQHQLRQSAISCCVRVKSTELDLASLLSAWRVTQTPEEWRSKQERKNKFAELLAHLSGAGSAQL